MRTFERLRRRRRRCRSSLACSFRRSRLQDEPGLRVTAATAAAADLIIVTLTYNTLFLARCTAEAPAAAAAGPSSFALLLLSV